MPLAAPQTFPQALRRLEFGVVDMMIAGMESDGVHTQEYKTLAPWAAPKPRTLVAKRGH